MARPSPLSRPALLRISERERCPKIIARIDRGNAKRKTPQAKLAMAFPLVTGGVPGTVAVVTGAEISLPQTLQNFSPAATSFPQPGQNNRLTSGSRRCKLLIRRIFTEQYARPGC